MKIKLLLFLFYITSLFSFSQVKITGEWQGLMFQNSDSLKKGKPVYFSFYLVNGILEGKFRQEIYGEASYISSDLLGSGNAKKEISFSLNKFSKNSNKELVSCSLKFDLIYNDTTGYLEGVYSSLKCQELKGKIILYKSVFEFKESNTPLVSHSWIDRFISDLENGLSSPDMRQIELKEFRFETLYFDYDKDYIKQEYRNYLLKIVKILKSHSDIRVKIVGNTDSDGSDNYNIDLSKRRAEALIIFFQTQGLMRDRIVLDYKGEKNPIDSNKTKEGKKRNRRVDFEFI
jgi:outer membrane protein OmpA-like peptidoglycan-associated protein